MDRRKEGKRAAFRRKCIQLASALLTAFLYDFYDTTERFSGFTPDKLIFRAQQIGDGMTEWTQAMLGRSVMKSDSFRTIDAVLRLAAASGKAAVEQACRTAVRNNVFTVKGMKSLIAGNAAKSRETAAVAPEEAVFFSPIYKEDER